MFVLRVDESGQPIAGAPAIEVPDDLQAGQRYNTLLTPDAAAKQAKDLADKARAEERTKLSADLEREKSARSRLQDDLDRREKAEKERLIAALPADQQVQARLTEMEQTIARERAARVEIETRSQQRDRAMELALYRERAVRDVPPEVADLVNGGSEVEIDAAVDSANRVHSAIESRLRQQFARGLASAGGPPPGSMPLPPFNPAYVPPPPPGMQPQFARPTNPLPPTETNDGQPSDVRAMTTEEAVRSGRYSGEVRDRLHAQVRGIRYPGQLGTAPRYQAQPPQAAPQVPGPYGTTVPQGYPTQAPAPPGYAPPPPGYPQPQYGAPPPPGYGYPQPPPGYPPQGYYPSAPQYQQPAPYYPQPAPQYAPSPADLARAAVERTHAGRNPVVQGDPHASSAMHDAHAYARGTGVSPQAAFDARFANTPPINPQQPS